MKTRICDMFGIEFPIFAFSHCRDVVAAVSRSGGMGVLGALAFTPEQLEIELSWVDEHVDGKPYGVDVVMPASLAGSEVDKLEAMIPDAHRRWVESVLDRHGVPPAARGRAEARRLARLDAREGSATGGHRAHSTRSSSSRTLWARRRQR